MKSDYYSIAVAESLIHSLANKGSVNGVVVPTKHLSATQKALTIPHHLVYICGLAVFNTSSHTLQQIKLCTNPATTPILFSKEQVNRFEHLQAVHHIETSSQSQARVYQLSPTLLPSDEMQAMITRDVEREMRTMSEHALIASQKLLDLEGLEREKNKLQPCGERKKTSLIVKETNKAQSRVTDALVVTTASVTSNPNEFEDLEKEHFSHMEWTKVKTKKKIGDEHRSSNMPFTNNNDSKDLSEQQPLCKTEHENTASLVKLPETALVINTTNPSNAESSKTIRLVSDKEENTQEKLEVSSFSYNEFCTLLNKVRDLESECKKKDETLLHAQSSHTKAIQLENEKFHERMQALQLRLYISETRLKTFEDALAQHVDAVDRNTAEGTMSKLREREEEIVTTPLFSRVTRKTVQQ